MSLQSLLNKKVNILRITSTTGAMGQTEVSNVLHRDLPCRINWKTGSKRIFFNKETYFRDARLYCSVIDVTVKDRVQYGTRTYQIVDVADVDEAGRLMTLDLKLVE